MSKEVLSGCDADENEQITALIDKKYRTKLTAENGAEKVFAALVRKGFSYGAVRQVLKKYTEIEDFYV